MRHVSVTRAAGSTRDARASRDRRDSRFGSASLFRHVVSGARTDLRAARQASETVSRFDPTESNRRGDVAHTRARATGFSRLERGVAEARVLLARDPSTARHGSERATFASPRSTSRSARERAASPRKDISSSRGGTPHRARVEDAWHARGRPWILPPSGRLFEGKRLVSNAGTSDATRTPPPRLPVRRRGEPKRPRRTAATRRKRVASGSTAANRRRLSKTVQPPPPPTRPPASRAKPNSDVTPWTFPPKHHRRDPFRTT